MKKPVKTPPTAPPDAEAQIPAVTGAKAQVPMAPGLEPQAPESPPTEAFDSLTVPTPSPQPSPTRGEGARASAACAANAFQGREGSAGILDPQALATAPAQATTPPPAAAKREPFPIVGIGASAGGLEALDQFLSHVPADCGLAFVIVVHLDPLHKGTMPELLQRSTAMKVEQVRDRVTVRPNQVYLIPPNRDLSFLHGVLHLFEPSPAHGLRLPIDFFFRSLAADLKERGIGVILSGMGSDGTLGLRAIKEAAGLTLVQDPAEAKFDGMPRSAIEAGLADIVAPAGELCAHLLAYLHPTVPTLPGEPILLAEDHSGLEKVIILLRNHTGHDFSLYKKSTLYRRIERRIRLQQLDKIAQYVRYLQENPPERDLLFKELLIGVTSFFRDPSAWQHLRDEVFPALLARRPGGGPLRAWVAGCSTGEEAYSLGIVFREVLENSAPDQPYSLQIFATDLDPDAIVTARLGFYPQNITADVAPERLRRFFVKEEDGGYRIGKEVREMVIFAEQNVIQDPPFTKMDLLICRNLLIYMTAELQRQLLALFHYSLNPGGVLFLGTAETVGGSSELFSTLDGKWRFFRRETPSLGEAPMHFAFPAARVLAEGPPDIALSPAPVNLKALLDQVLLERVTPVSILATAKGEILFTTGRTGKYLEPVVGQASLNLFAMAREGLRDILPSLCQQAQQLAGVTPAVQRGLRIRTNGSFQVVDLSIHELRDPEPLRGMLLLVFTEVAAAPVPRRGRRHAGTGAQTPLPEELELQQLRESLQTTREEMQTSQEELKSANEELQSTNEELQSTNEELTTSKEEMQSLNEELQTVNTELQAKVENLSRVNDDMKNLLDSTEIATLFLEEDLRIRRFTSQAAKLINLIPGDVGRPITHIASEVLYPELAQDVAEVLRSLIFREKLIGTQDGRWFNARIMPYRTLDNRIDGVVVTLVDMTKSKQLENELRQALAELGRLAEVPSRAIDGQGTVA